MAHNLNKALVGFCNPLLDISAVVDDKLLKEFNLEANNAILASPEHLPLFQKLIDSYNAQLLPGGGGQNTLRGVQLLLPPKSAVFVGAVGKDENATRLKNAATKAGLEVNYMVNPEKPTGTCALLITGVNRSMIANLSAAETYQADHIKAPENWKLIEDARFFYITGFFFTVSPETIEAVSRHSMEKGKTYTMNLSAPFVPEFYKDNLLSTLPYIDILFGNETEAASVAKALGLENTTDVRAIAKDVADYRRPEGCAKPRLVVFTQGASSTVVASSDADGVRVYSVTPIPDSEIGDTNGAGDAFVAGFLSRYVQDQPLDQCVEAGHWLGGEVVRQVGPNYPDGELKFTPSGNFKPAFESL